VTLLIALLLMDHMGISGFWPHFGVVVVWLAHLCTR
jgi:hypothetical protein